MENIVMSIKKYLEMNLISVLNNPWEIDMLLNR